MRATMRPSAGQTQLALPRQPAPRRVRVAWAWRPRFAPGLHPVLEVFLEVVCYGSKDARVGIAEVRVENPSICGT